MAASEEILIQTAVTKTMIRLVNHFLPKASFYGFFLTIKTSFHEVAWDIWIYVFEKLLNSNVRKIRALRNYYFTVFKIVITSSFWLILREMREGQNLYIFRRLAFIYLLVAFGEGGILESKLLKVVFLLPWIFINCLNRLFGFLYSLVCLQFFPFSVFSFSSSVLICYLQDV